MTQDSLDLLYQQILRLGEDGLAVRRFLDGGAVDEFQMLAILRRPVPVKLLELLAVREPWSRSPRLLAAVAAHPRTPRTVALQLLPALHWRSLSEVAGSLGAPVAVKVRAEGQLRDAVRDLRLGDRISLARTATPGVLRALLVDPEARVVRAVLASPRLREADVLSALRQPDVPVVLLEAVADARGWSERYVVRRELVLQTRTPLALALAQLTHLMPSDLAIAAEDPRVRKLVRAAARGLLDDGWRGPEA